MTIDVIDNHIYATACVIVRRLHSPGVASAPLERQAESVAELIRSAVRFSEIEKARPPEPISPLHYRNKEHRHVMPGDELWAGQEAEIAAARAK